MDYDKIAPMMRRLWAPIAIVTASSEGRDNAQAAVSIGGASIVADRPRVVVQLYKTNLTHDLAVESGAFALCFTRRDQLDLVHDLGFASGHEGDKMAGLAYSKGVTGSPVLDDCLGFLDCRVINAMDGGDMTVFLADVVDGGMRSEGEPLDGPHWRDVIPQSWTDEWNEKIAKEVEHSRRVMDIIDPARFSGL